MPTTNERGHTVPVEGVDSPSYDGIFDTFPSLNDVILCADTSERSTKIAGLSFTPSASRPALFWRADAPTGRQLEAWDGTTIYTYHGVSSWTTFTGYTASWSAGVTVRYRAVGGTLELKGRALRSSSLAVGGNSQIGTLPFTLEYAIQIPVASGIQPDRLLTLEIETGGLMRVYNLAASAGVITTVDFTGIRLPLA